MKITLSQPGDLPEVLEVFRLAAADPRGLIREPDEITEQYVARFLKANERGGLSIVARADDNRVLGEIHAVPIGIRALRGIFTDLTIAVHPDAQGQNIGKRLFREFLLRVERDFPHILRVELFTRSDNERNRRFYESLGFCNEGAQEHKIIDAEGQLRTPLHMAWFNPSFSIERVY